MPSSKCLPILLSPPLSLTSGVAARAGEDHLRQWRHPATINLPPPSLPPPDCSAQEEQRELAKTICVSGAILLSTVSNFLDFFKLEAGKVSTCGTAAGEWG